MFLPPGLCRRLTTGWLAPQPFLSHWVILSISCPLRESLSHVLLPFQVLATVSSVVLMRRSGHGRVDQLYRSIDGILQPYLWQSVGTGTGSRFLVTHSLQLRGNPGQNRLPEPPRSKEGLMRSPILWAATLPRWPSFRRS